MHAQNTALFLGQVPHPQTGRPEINLEVGRMFIDQLEMIAEKTKGNLTEDEDEMLKGTLTELRLAFVRAQGGVVSGAFSQTDSDLDEEDEAAPPQQIGKGPETAPSKPTPAPEEETGSRKKFTKSYGS